MNLKPVLDTIKPYAVKAGKAAAVAVLTLIIEKVGSDKDNKKK